MNVLEKISEEIDKKADYYESDEQGREHIRMVDMVEVEEIIRSHMNNHSGDFNEMVSNWIPVEDTDHTPENESYVLVSFSNFNVPDIARYEENEEGGTYYPGDDEESYLKYGLFVNAWQLLPKPYKGE